MDGEDFSSRDQVELDPFVPIGRFPLEQFSTGDLIARDYPDPFGEGFRRVVPLVIVSPHLGDDPQGEHLGYTGYGAHQGDLVFQTVSRDLGHQFGFQMDDPLVEGTHIGKHFSKVSEDINRQLDRGALLNLQPFDFVAVEVGDRFRRETIQYRLDDPEASGTVDGNNPKNGEPTAGQDTVGPIGDLRPLNLPG